MSAGAEDAAQRRLKIGVVVMFLVSIVSNALASSGVLTGKDIGEVSDENPTFITPDGQTFSVWSVIYTLETVLVMAQTCPSERSEQLLRQKCRVTGATVRTRIIIAFLANAVWLPAFLALQFSLALVIILIYLAALLSVYAAVKPRSTASLCEWLIYGAGISANASWLVVASCANAFTVARAEGWRDENGVGGAPEAALVVVFGVAALASARAVLGYDLAWSAVAAWAAMGVFRAQTNEDPEKFPPAAMSSLLAEGAKWSAIVVALFSLVGLALAARSYRKACGDASAALGGGREADPGLVTNA